MSLNPGKKSEPDQSMYLIDTQYGLDAGIQNVTSTGDLSSFISLTKPQKNAVLLFKCTTEMNGAATIKLLDADDTEKISLVLPSGTAAGTAVTSALTTAASSVDLAAGQYNVNVSAAATGGAGIPLLICKEKFDVSIAD